MIDNLISRSELLKKSIRVTETDEGGWERVLRAVPVTDVENAPAVDAVEVIRCKDCVHYRANLLPHAVGECEMRQFPAIESDFCSYGERKGESDD